MPHNYLKPYAQKLRREMTKEERRLWYDFLKDLPVQIVRQKIIGKYIVDFYCKSAQVAIELDGSQHYDEDGRKADAIRDEFLRNKGITVLRYTNIQINDRFRSVCEDIANHLQPYTEITQ